MEQLKRSEATTEHGRTSVKLSGVQRSLVDIDEAQWRWEISGELNGAHMCSLELGRTWQSWTKIGMQNP